MHKFLIHFALFGALGLGALTAPIQPYVETNPELIGGHFEGDMIMSYTRNGLLNPARLWPNKVIFYKTDGSFDDWQEFYIRHAMNIIELISCVRFKRADEQTVSFVNITSASAGCFSNVGYLGNIQTLNLELASLGRGCFSSGVLQHELLHTVGFYHQQGSPERDEYVRIIEENITAGRENAFRKLDASLVGNYNVPYDYGSIMHYPKNAFSKNGQPTIVPLRSTKAQLGQRLGMRFSDILRLNRMYKCKWPILNNEPNNELTPESSVPLKWI